MNDLALTHHPVTDLYPDCDDPAALELSDEQAAFFEEYGYVAGVKVLTDAQCDALIEELAGLTDPKHPANALFHEYHSNESANPSTVLFHALGAWRAAPGFHDLLWNQAVLRPAARLLGGPVRFWHDQLFCKPAMHGGVVAWHQDYSYWTRTQPMAHLTCWIALDDADRDNGCLHYIPGSHRWELLPVTGLAGGMESIRDVLTPEQFEQFREPKAVELKRGYATFHHPLMVHGSFENRTPRPRRATVLNFLRDGVHSTTDEPLLAGVPVIPPGATVDGMFFPLLYRP